MSQHETGFAAPLGALAMFLVTTVAVAGPPVAPPSRTSDGALSTSVHYGDLDLGNAAGLEVLHRRLRQAAAAVCRPLEGAELTRRRQYRDCREQALAAALGRLEDPERVAVHSRPGAGEPKQDPPERVTGGS
jgi:UrcA family protein